MRHPFQNFYLWCLASAIPLLITPPLQAQHLLNKKISISFAHQPLHQALTKIGEKGGFYFSYNSDLIAGDSLVSLTTSGEPVREILGMLLGEGYQYSESGNYIIIRGEPGNAKTFLIRGYVVDKGSGEKIPDASVYEGRQLISTLTNADGYFQLKVHSRLPVTTLTVSKIHFNDTSYTLNAVNDQTLTLRVSPIRSILLDSVTVTPNSRLEGTWFGKFFISSRQKVQDINLSRFFVRQPFQYSVVPGIGTHGKIGAQVVNKFSMNLLGGYTAGVNGFEVGGLFNLDKKEVKYVQVAGLFNTVGGGVKGLQVAGLHNGVMDSVNGLQIAGINNMVRGSMRGMEASGLFNQVSGDVSGVMVTGLWNVAAQHMGGVQIGGILNQTHSLTGLQVAGIGNISKSAVNGAQIAAIFNYTPQLKGLQIGLVNISDSSSGYSIGLINIIRHGYHRISLSYNEALDVNIAYKAGNKKLYNILLAGIRLQGHRNVYSLGYGIGSEFTFTSALSLTTELSEQAILTGGWKHIPQLTRLQPALQVQVGRRISLFAGPSFSVFYTEPSSTRPNEGTVEPVHHYTWGDHVDGWIGGQAGITFF